MIKTLPLTVWPLAAAVGAAVSAPALAQRVDEEVVVTGRRLEETIPQELERFGNRLETVDRGAIDLGGFNDLSQTLQMQVPAFYVAPKNGPFDYMNCSLQGSRCEDVLFLVDGVRIANRLYNTTTPLDTIPAHTIDRVEVLYGGQGIFYGTQSVAGVVNIVTSEFTGEPGGHVDIGFDEHDGTHVSADYRTGFDGHNFVLFASRDESDGFQPFADEDFEPSATMRKRGYEVSSFGLKYGYDFSPGSRLSVLVQRTENDVDNALPYAVAERDNRRVEDLVTMKWDYALGDDVDLYVKAYYHDWDTRWDDVRNDLGPNGELTGTRTMLFDDAFWGFEDYGVTALASIRASDLIEYSVGYDFQRFWGNDEVWLIQDKTETAHAVYGQVRTSDAALPRSDVAFGVRYNTTSGNADGAVWNLSARHNLTDRLYLRGQVGTSFRLPDAEELYLRDCCEVGNPNLESEESRNLEIGLGGGSVGGAFGWQLVYFTREVDNLIGIDFDDPAFPDGIYTNFDQTAEFDGFELILNGRLSDTLSATLSYTTNDAELDGSGEQIQDIPETLAKLGLTYRSAAAPFELGLSVVNVGDVFDEVSRIGRIEHGGYTVVDLSAAYYLDAERRHRIGARIENAFDEEYATSLGRGTRDLDGSAYLYRNLGAPRTLNVSYSFRW
ncbi:MAG TPA: TonB-dependent receptor [Gammaproteobacteria bacterium]